MLIARSKYRYYPIIVLFVAFILARREDHNVILKFGIVPMGIVYFCIGNMCKKYHFLRKYITLGNGYSL